MNYGTNNYYNNVQSASVSSGAVQAVVNRVFSIMAIGLAITGGVSLLTINIPQLLGIALKTFWVFAVAELGLVIYLSFGIRKMSASAALKWFLLYSALNGITLSPVFLVYTQSSITSAFFISAAMFGSMAIWGLTTKKDLTSLGSLMVMGLFGIIIASVANIFMQNSGFELVLSYITVGIFIGLTAWDAQKIKHLAMSGEGFGSMAILGALQLYLDFINLFLRILYIMGNRRN